MGMDSEFKQAFLDESEEHIATLSSSVIELEKRPDDEEIINAMFRAAHTLKSASMAMGYQNLSVLCHRTEDLMDLVRKKKIVVTSGVIDVLLEAVDKMEAMANKIRSADADFDASGAIAKIDKVMQRTGESRDGSPEETPARISKAAVKMASGKTSRTEKKIKQTATMKKTKKSEKAKETKHLKARHSRHSNEGKNESKNKKTGNEKREAVSIAANISDMGEGVSKNAGKEDGEGVKENGNYKITVSLKNCDLPGARGFLLINDLESVGALVSTHPDIHTIEAGAMDEITLLIKPENDIFERAILLLKKNTDISYSIIEGPSGGENMKDSEKDPEEKALPHEQITDQASAVQANGIALADAQPKPEEPEKKTIDTVRVRMGILDSMMSLTGELVIGKMRMLQLSRKYDIPELTEAVSMFERSITDLQNEVMSIRMLPVDMVFSRFPRMVRDLAKKRGKEIDFVINGKEVEVDRTVIDELYDPLMHLLRNSIDHGIETPEERERKNKPRTGTITLSAVRERNSIIIEVIDDGRGINAEEVKKSALNKGYITEEEVKKMKEKDAINLILKSGISTAQEITDTSGRGVGLDVVTQRLKELSGNFNIETAVDKGTKISLSLPITLAIIMAIMVDVRGEVYAVPLRTVNEIIKVRDDDIKRVMGSGQIIMLRNEVVPLVRANEILTLNVDERKFAQGGEAGAGAENIQATEHDVLILEINGKKQGLVVDRVIGQEEIVVRPLDSLMKGAKNISGATIRGDGSIAFIVDV